MSDREEEMEEMIESAKKQVLSWYNLDTKREFIETSIWSASDQFNSHKAGNLTKLFVLSGGEAKGTIIADYFNGIVIAYDRTFNNIRIFRGMIK
jgi:hypothetical protein